MFFILVAVITVVVTTVKVVVTVVKDMLMPKHFVRVKNLKLSLKGVFLLLNVFNTC